jgi:hypothetical protein
VNDGFGVAAGAIDVASGFESGAQIGVIEDFAVVDNLQAAIFIGHGLMAVGEIDDAQAAEAESDEFIAKDAAIVGTAVSDAIGHGANEVAVYDAIR